MFITKKSIFPNRRWLRILWVFQWLMVFGFFIPTAAMGQSRFFSDESFIIADFSDGNINRNQITSSIMGNEQGISLRIYMPEDSSGLYIHTEHSGRISLNWFLTELGRISNRKQERITPVFFHCEGVEEALDTLLKKTPLEERLFYLPQGERWPAISDMISDKKDIIFFSFSKVRANSKLLYAWDYIAEFPESSLDEPHFEGKYTSGDIARSLLMVNNLRNVTPVERRTADEFNQNPVYLAHLLKCWQYTGKKPNFIFIEGPPGGFPSVAYNLNLISSVNGQITYNEKPLETVFWRSSSKSITSGYFSFPYSGDELSLTPFRPGYTFIPENVIINPESQGNDQLHFFALPLLLSDGLEAHFSFANSLENSVRPDEMNKGKDHGFTTDLLKGEVLKLSDSAYITIGSAKEYSMTGKSFTISAWIKMLTLEGQRDFSILGTPDYIFRKGLHLQIRNEKPYFGFYSSDLEADQTLIAGKWYHVVFRYNVANGEQAIFFDGTKIASSLNHISFIGESNLQVGYCINQNNFFQGYIDDLAIWSRALGEEEIRRLATEEIQFEKPAEELNLSTFIILLVILLVIILIVFLIKKRISNKSEPMTEIKTPQTREPSVNAVFLFGEFRISDKHGAPIAPRFSPKLRELFLLILLYTIENQKGITTAELTEILWPGVDKEKAANSRGVNFNKLRKIVAAIEGLEIQFEGTYWKVIIDSPCYCDYLELQTVFGGSRNPDYSQLLQYFSIVKRGKFLQDSGYEWLDSFKGRMANEVIDLLFQLTTMLNKDKHAIILEEISRRILSADDMNERALYMEISFLMKNGKENVAKYTFNNFCSNHEKFYGEAYPDNFEQFMARRKNNKA